MAFWAQGLTLLLVQQSPGPRPSVSVSVSFIAVHGRSDETDAGSRSHNRPPMNPGERPRTHPHAPPTQLESVLGSDSGQAQVTVMPHRVVQHSLPIGDRG